VYKLSARGVCVVVSGSHTNKQDLNEFIIYSDF